MSFLPKVVRKTGDSNANLSETRDQFSRSPAPDLESSSGLSLQNTTICDSKQKNNDTGSGGSSLVPILDGVQGSDRQVKIRKFLESRNESIDQPQRTVEKNLHKSLRPLPQLKPGSEIDLHEDRRPLAGKPTGNSDPLGDEKEVPTGGPSLLVEAIPNDDESEDEKSRKRKGSGRGLGRRKSGPPSRRRRFLSYLIIGGRREDTAFGVPELFYNMNYRTCFIAKVMGIKAAKWTLASIPTLVASFADNKGLVDFPRKHSWVIAIPLFGYFSLFITIRMVTYFQTTRWVAICLVLQAICIAYISYSLSCSVRTAMIPLICLTLIWTYATVALVSASKKIDLTEDAAILLVILLILVFGAFYFPITELWTARNGIRATAKQLIGTVWLPTLMMAHSLILMEMAELKALMDGYRIELGPKNYMIVAAFLI